MDIEPCLYKTGLLFSNPIIVDSTPFSQFPPSKINGNSVLKYSKTCCELVGLIDVKGFALGAAKGKSSLFNNSKAIGWLGTLTATVSFPAEIIEDIESCFFKINVKVFEAIFNFVHSFK